MFDWSNYLVLAHDLAGRQDEASWRSAISRAYYSAYWFARIDLNLENAIRNSRDKHDAVWQYYVNEYNKQGQSIGKNGKALSRVRGAADYEAGYRVTQTDAMAQLVKAEKLIADIKMLP